MCPIIIIFMVLLLFYAGSQVAVLSLAEQVGDQAVTVAQGWEVFAALWPIGLFMFLLGVITVLLASRVRSMLKERRERSAETQ